VLERTTAYYAACNQAEQSLAGMDKTLQRMYASLIIASPVVRACNTFRNLRFSFYYRINMPFPSSAGALFTLFPLVVMLQKMMLHTILFVGDDRT
jgi:hypothetical protein